MVAATLKQANLQAYGNVPELEDRPHGRRFPCDRLVSLGLVESRGQGTHDLLLRSDLPLLPLRA